MGLTNQAKMKSIHSPKACDEILKNKNFEVLSMVDFLNVMTEGTSNDFYYLKLFTGTNLFLTNGEEHLSAKKKLKLFFTPSVIDSIFPHIKQIVRRCIDELPANSEIDLLEKFIIKVSSYSIYQALGLSKKYHDKYLPYMNILLKALSLSQPLKLKDYYELERTIDKLFHLIEKDLLENQSSSPGDMNFYTFSRNKEMFSREKTIAHIIFLLGAGISNQFTMANMFLNLFNMGKEKRELFLKNNSSFEVVDKLLYFSGGVETIYRRITTEELAEKFEMSVGDLTAIELAKANKEVAGKCPFSTTVKSPSNLNFAFGKGIHRCIGDYYSCLILEEVLTYFFKVFPNSRQLSNHDEPFYTTSENRKLFVLLN